MPQFFVSPENINGNLFALDKTESHHASNVFRLSKGDLVNLFDGKGGVFLAEITGITNGVVAGLVKSKKSMYYKPEIILFAPVVKPERFDWLLEKSVELGVNRIVPIMTKRTEIKLKNKAERWKKIILSAAKQSMAPVLAGICEPLEFNSAVRTESKGLLNIIFNCESASKSVREIISQKTIIDKAGLWVGPEGGFSAEEIQFALKNGFAEASLGKNILRAETACLAAVSLLRC